MNDSCSQVLSGNSHIDELSNTVRPSRKPFSLVPHWTPQECVSQKMARKEQKGVFFIQVFRLALLAFTSFSQPASVHRRVVMWFQCLGPCGIVPSGGKPLRLCWHITPPIINSRSALSFLLHLSSLLLSAPSFCFACVLISAAGSFTSTQLQHLLLISVSTIIPFFIPTALYCTD